MPTDDDTSVIVVGDGIFPSRTSFNIATSIATVEQSQPPNPAQKTFEWPWKFFPSFLFTTLFYAFCSVGLWSSSVNSGMPTMFCDLSLLEDDGP